MQETAALPDPPVHDGGPDAHLLQAWVEHQRHADFAEIVRRHLGLVQGIARRQLDHDSSEDIGQRVFALLARKAPALTGHPSLAAWLHRVTLLECRNAVRSRVRDRRNQEAAMETHRTAAARDPLAEALPYLDAAIGALPESDRQLILLRYSEGLTFSEAARRVGRKEAALRQQASRALEKLSTILRRRGVCVPATTLATGLGIHLAGSTTATAAALATTAALTATGSITGLSLAGVALFTMTVKQSLIAGATLAALLVSIPLVWQQQRISQQERSLAGTDHGASAGSPTGKGGITSSNEKSTSSRRADRKMSFLERSRMEIAIPGILQTALTDSLNEWFQRDATMEARRMSLSLGLTAETEKDLREFLTSERAKLIQNIDFSEDKEIDQVARRRETQARLDAWYAARLTPAQDENRKRIDAARDTALAQRLSEEAVQKFTATVELSSDQKSRLEEAAREKITRVLETKNYGNSFSSGVAVQLMENELPIEERAEDIVDSVLDADQQDLWRMAIQRDSSMGETMQNHISGTLLQQLEKIKLARGDSAGSPDE